MIRNVKSGLHPRRRLPWVVLCLLLLVGFAAIQASAVADDFLHDHGKASHDNCPLCQGAHIQLLPAIVAQSIMAPVVTHWHYSPREVQPLSVHTRSFHPSRAPPAPAVLLSQTL